MFSAASRIEFDLREARGAWVCGVTRWARDGFILSFSQRISIDLRGKRGLPIESRPCRQHDHRASVHEYRLPLPAEQLELAR